MSRSEWHVAQAHALAEARRQGEQAAALRAQAEISYAYRDGYDTAKSRARKIIVVVFVFAFAMGAWVF